MSPPTSAIPDRYYAIFGVYEPLLTAVGFLGAIADPRTTYIGQAPWPKGTLPPDELPDATTVTVIQLAHVCFLLGIVNFSILSVARRHLRDQVALQEKVVSALLIPLLLGDFLHLFVTIWALGNEKWNFRAWTPMLWTTLGLGLTLMVPRICWHLGIGRYVDSRDGRSVQKGTSGKPSS